MDREQLRTEFRQAVQEAKRSGRGMLPRLVTLHQIEMDSKGYAKRCPWCEKKQTFKISNQNGSWRFICFNDQCQANEGGDEVGFLSIREGISRREACKRLLEIAGIENPFDRERKARPKKERAESFIETEAEITAPDFIKIPEEGRSVYEAAWDLMSLSQAHRKEIREKRGMPDAWIDALGFRTACPANQRILAPILEQFPPNELLRSGIATRDNRDKSLRISDSMCGREFNEQSGRWETNENIIIPYINSSGRIELLRPHKKSLSNARWREREEVSEYYEKTHHNLRKIYGEHLIEDRPPEWPRTAIICEGEFKAMALAICGIPAIAFQGISFFEQNSRDSQAINDTAELLRSHGIREVIVVFDNEDKSDKPFHKRFFSKIWSRYTAECLEDTGFTALHGMLPNDWMENGKADWDSRLAYHVRTCRETSTAIKKASAEFNKILNDRPRKGQAKNYKPCIQHVQRQVDYLDAEEDVINQELHRLRHVPKIFPGGKYEIELAAEIQNFCHENYTHHLKVKQLCDALRDSIGGFYRIKPAPEKLQEKCSDVIKEIRPLIQELEEESDKSESKELELRKLRAAMKACYTILYRFPKPFTDFTATSKYKVLVTEVDGSTRQDRLVVFRDRNGVRSKSCQLSSKLMRSAQELRTFFLSMGGYHWFGGQEECDMFCQELDFRNYQKVIEEIDTYGWNKDGKFYLLGDCAVKEGGEFIFPDRNGIIWINGTGYRNSDNMAAFTTKPPMLFPECKNPKEFYESMDWEQERKEIGEIWQNLLDDYAESFGGYAGYAAVAGMIQYLSHPEVRPQIGGKPGLAVQGEKGSGKTKSIEYLMRVMGYPLNYGYISLGGTKVGVERSLCQFSNLPFHIDEWRNENADPRLEDLLRNCYNETATPKGTPNGNKGVRKLIPSTIPIVTGEDWTTDAALRSRYIRIIASQAFDNTLTGDEDESTQRQSGIDQQSKRDRRYYRIMERSEQYHRIGRFLFKYRDKFSEETIRLAKSFQASGNAMSRIRDSRARQVFGVFIGALTAAQKLITGAADFGAGKNEKILEWFINHGAESAEETDRDVFRRLFFGECVNMIERGVQGIDKLIRMRKGHLDEAGRVRLYESVNEPSGRLFVLVAASELFPEYKRDKRMVGETAPIAQNNILGELRTQPAWIPGPNIKGRQHRFAIPGEKNSKRTWWVLDYKKLEPELKSVFLKVWERELAHQNLELAEDGETIINMSPEEVRMSL